MAILKRQEYDSITIKVNGLMELRLATVIEEDGQELGRKFFREVLEPGQNVSTYPGKVKSLCALIWTPQVISDYAAAKAAALTHP
jgi:hypothetical protein